MTPILLLKFLHIYFNSIKVRLELSKCTALGSAGAFQFHKGTIRTMMKERAEYPRYNFNSIKVRLERNS